MYARMAQDAEEEGFKEIAAKFRMVGAIEKHHEERYKKLVGNLEGGVVFSRGHIVVGKFAPKVCPVCNHPQSFFEIDAQNY